MTPEDVQPTKKPTKSGRPHDDADWKMLQAAVAFLKKKGLFEEFRNAYTQGVL